MESQASTVHKGTGPGTHPILIVAAIAVILFSAVGTGAIMGWIPTGNAKVGDPVAATTTTVTTAAAPAPAVVSAASTPEPKATKPAVRKAAAERHVIARQAETPQARPAPQAMDAEARVSPPPPPVQVAQAQVAQARPLCYDCGVIESIREVEKAGDAGALGAIAGGVAGGVLGHQVGAGRGRDLMTVVGAIGGAVAGHQIEKNVKKSKTYEIVVRFEDGTTRTLSQASAPSWRAGDHVKVLGSEIQPSG